MVEVLCETWAKVVAGLGWSALGFFAGYITCKIQRDRERIREAVVAIEGSAAQRHEGEVKREVRSKRTQWQSLTAGLFIVLLSIFTVGQSWYFSGRDREITQCQAEYNADFAEVLTKRSEYSDEDRRALTEMVTTVLNGPNDVTRRQAIVNYLETTEKNAKLRKENPLPALDERDCG